MLVTRSNLMITILRVFLEEELSESLPILTFKGYEWFVYIYLFKSLVVTHPVFNVVQNFAKRKSVSLRGE